MTEQHEHSAAMTGLFLMGLVRDTARIEIQRRLQDGGLSPESAALASSKLYDLPERQLYALVAEATADLLTAFEMGELLGHDASNFTLLQRATAALADKLLPLVCPGDPAAATKAATVPAPEALQ